MAWVTVAPNNEGGGVIEPRPILICLGNRYTGYGAEHDTAEWLRCLRPVIPERCARSPSSKLTGFNGTTLQGRETSQNKFLRENGFRFNRMVGPKDASFAQAFLSEYIYKRLTLAQLLGQRGVFLTWVGELPLQVGLHGLRGPDRRDEDVDGDGAVPRLGVDDDLGFGRIAASNTQERRRISEQVWYE